MLCYSRPTYSQQPQPQRQQAGTRYQRCGRARYHFRHRCQGLALIEIVIVVMIIGFLSSLAIPSLIAAMDRSRQNGTLADLRTIADGVERYAVDHRVYPLVSDISALRAALEPNYIKKMPVADGWSHPLIYEVDTHGSTFTLLSLGKDGQRQEGPLEESTHYFESDIVLVDGVFVQRPDGEQGKAPKTPPVQEDGSEIQEGQES